MSRLTGKTARWHPVAVALLGLVLVGFVCARCGIVKINTGHSPNPDPGNKLLTELSRDPVFAVPPPAANDVHLVRYPAAYVNEGLGESSWENPHIMLTFKSSAPPIEIFRFYAQRASVAGWRVTKRNPRGVPTDWEKVYDGGTYAAMGIGQSSVPRSAIRLYRIGAETGLKQSAYSH
jgi:hypothetical protein